MFWQILVIKFLYAKSDSLSVHCFYNNFQNLRSRIGASTSSSRIRNVRSPFFKNFKICIMKIAKNPFFLVFMAYALTLMYSCRDKVVVQAPDKCSSFPCGNLSGFDCVEGACVCPQGKYPVGHICASLNPNEYYGTSNCNTLDTMKINFIQPTPFNNRIATFLTTKTFATQMDGFRYRDNVQDLDSLVLLFPRTFKKDTLECTVNATGRFFETDKLKLTLKYYAIYQNNRLVDSCSVVLHK